MLVFVFFISGKPQKNVKNAFNDSLQPELTPSKICFVEPKYFQLSNVKTLKEFSKTPNHFGAFVLKIFKKQIKVDCFCSLLHIFHAQKIK